MIQSRLVKKILITNIVSLNPGDAAILRGCIEILRKKYGADTEIVVFDRFADAARKYYPWASFRQALFIQPEHGFLMRVLGRIGYSHWLDRLKFLRYYMTVYLIKSRLSVLARVFLLLNKSEIDGLREYVFADLILSSGGTYLSEKYYLQPAIMDYRISLITGNKFGFFTQTLGPFREEKNQKYFRKIFSKASVILLRDERSRDHILELGIDPKYIHLAADAAFVLNQNTVGPPSSIRAKGVSRLAISVRNMTLFHDQESHDDKASYLEAMALAASIAVEEFGAEVTFLSTCQGMTEYWTDDAETADQVYALLPEDIRKHVEVDRQFRQPDKVVEIYQSFDAVIATRMHAAILSLCAGTPTLGIAYEFKMEELFKNIGMTELVMSIDALYVGDLKTCVRRLLGESEAYRSRVKVAAEEMYKNAWSAENALPEITAY